MRNSHTCGRGALIIALTRQTPICRPRFLTSLCFFPHSQSSRKDLLRLGAQRDGWLKPDFSVTGTDHPCPASYGLVFIIWDQPEYDEGALERYVRGLANLSLLFEPGERFSYSNI